MSVTPTAPASTVLQVDDVSAHYGSVTAVDHVSFDIHENEFFALLGPSGCGKTTLLRSIAGFEAPTSGDIRLDGQSLLAQPPHKRPVNMMFQSYALFQHMSVEKNIAYGLLAESLPRNEVRRRVGEIIEIIGLESLRLRRPAQLSGGQRQRVALARALVKRPRVLLLDEPLSALDRKVRVEMQTELKRLQQEAGMTFIVVTHDQDEAMSMADRIAVLNRGGLEQLDSPVDLYRSPQSRFVASFIGSANLIDGTATATGIILPGVGEVPGTHRIAAGRPATLVVRGEDFTVESGTGDGSAVSTPGTRFAGTVTDVTFLGGSSTLTVTANGFDQPLRATVHRATELTRGAPVVLVLPPHHAVIVDHPESPSPSQPTPAQPRKDHE